MKSPNSGDQRGQTGATDEFAVIRRMQRRFESAARSVWPEGPLPPPGDTWIGDDAAVVAVHPADQVIWATDLVIGGVHVDLDLGGLDDAGYKALMVAVSDLAAMGAWPSFALVSVAAPQGTDLDLLGEGLAAAAAASECVVVGGDLSGAPVLVVSSAVMGTLRTAPDRGPLLRSGAGAGDRLFLTGPLGASAAGLRLLRSSERPAAGESPAATTASDPAESALIAAHLRPVARLIEGETARLAGASAAIDISDGLASDLTHLGASSGVGVELDAIPVARRATEEEALGGGEDYELLVATPDPDALIGAYRAAGLRPPVAIGWCTDRPGRYRLAGAALPAGGWRHRF